MCYGPEQVQNRFLLFSIGVYLENGDIKISSGEQLRRSLGQLENLHEGLTKTVSCYRGLFLARGVRYR